MENFAKKLQKPNCKIFLLLDNPPCHLKNINVSNIKVVFLPKYNIYVSITRSGNNQSNKNNLSKTSSTICVGKNG